MANLKYNSLRSTRVLAFGLLFMASMGSICCALHAQQTKAQERGDETPLRSPRAELPQAPQRRRYTQTFPAFGGVRPYTFTIVGNLPAGLLWTKADNGMLLDGTPLNSGNFPLSISVTDALGENLRQDYVLQVAPLDNGSSVNLPVTESVSVTDVPSVGSLLQVGITEALKVTDTFSVILPVQVNINEAISVADSFTISPSVSVSISESVKVSDTPSVSPPIQVIVTEAVSVTDIVAALPPIIVAVSEPISVTDTPIASPPIQVNISEALSVNDGISAIGSILVSVSEPVKVTDTPSASPPIQVSVTEAVSVTDIVAALPPVFVVISEPISVTDTPIASPPIQVNIGEAISLTDSVAVSPSIFVSISEPVKVTDTPSALPPIQVSITEAVSVTDIVGALPPVLVVISEPIAVTDTPTVSPPIQVNIGEAVSVTDGIATTGSIFVTISEVVSVTDTPLFPAAPLMITSSSKLPDGALRTPYGFTFTASGGSGSWYGWQVESGYLLPKGLQLSSGGFLNGTPAVPGSFSFGVQVTDSVGNTTAQVVTVVVTKELRSTTTLIASTVVVSAGASDTLTATVSPIPTQPSTVAFYEEKTLLGTSAVDPTTGIASQYLAPLTAGNHHYHAIFAGDDESRSSRDHLTLTVLKDQISLAFAAGTSSSAYGGQVALGATLTNLYQNGDWVLAPSGVIDFTLDSSGGRLLGSEPLSLHLQTYGATLLTQDIPVGAHTIFTTYRGDKNYSAATSAGWSINVAKASTSITVAPSSITYGTGPTQLTALLYFSGPGVPSGAVTFAVDNGAAVQAKCPGSTSPITCTAKYQTDTLQAGYRSIYVSQAESDDYSAASGQATLTISQASQTITFKGLPAKVEYKKVVPYSLDATASSGLSVTYFVSGPAEISGSTLTITGAGTVSVTAYQWGDGNYSAASPVAQTITVTSP